MKIHSGTAVVVGLFVVLAVGWFSYRPYIPPSWMRAFAQDISDRATPDPDAPPPRDVREAKPLVTPDHPYVCFARLTPFAWDRLIVIPSGGDPARVLPPDEAEAAAKEMHGDPRYQLIVLFRDGKMIAREWFYTFWADLSALTGDGFTPATAVFTVATRNGTYVLTPVDPVPEVCK